MADVRHQRFTKSVFYAPPLTAKSIENFHYQLIWCWLVLINVKMLVITKINKFVPICWLSKCWTDNEFSECFHARSRSMFCDVRVCYRLMDVTVKAMHTTSQHILLKSLSINAKTCLNGLGLWRTHKLLMLWLLILRVLVFTAVSADTLTIKWITLRCKSFLNNQSL